MTEAEIDLLYRLYDDQRRYVQCNGAVGACMEYLDSHFATRMIVQRQLRVVDMFEEYVRGRVLEWGCQHGQDSCVFRERFASDVELHACDVLPEQAYRPFRQFSGAQYIELTHPYHLPYTDNYFDLVISNGVLEHVADDVASLREIHRVLRPGGTFVLTCLPNYYSYTEAVARLRGRGHPRLYSMSQASGMLRRSGFRVIRSRYFFMIPVMLLGFPKTAQRLYQKLMGSIGWTFNDILEALWPVNRLASNLLLVARKEATQ